MKEHRFTQVMLPGVMPTICRPCGGTGKVAGAGCVPTACFGCDGTGEAVIKEVRIEGGRYAKPWDQEVTKALVEQLQPSWRRKGRPPKAKK